VGPLSQNDCRALSSALGVIYGARSIAEFPWAVLSAVRGLLACNTICLNEMSGGAMTSWITEPSDAFPKLALREAFLRNIAQHPVLTHYMTTADASSYRISDFVSHRRFHRLPLYGEYYRPSSVEYQLLSAISMGPNQLGVALDRDVVDFSDEERLSVDLVRPHLVQAYRNAQSIDLLTHALAAGGSRLLFVSRRDSRVNFVDDTRLLLAKYFKAWDISAPLPDMLLRWLGSERSRFAEDGDVPAPSSPLLIPSALGTLTLRFVWGGRNADSDLMVLEEVQTPVLAQTGRMNLTLRESEILSLLEEGKTNADIGFALFISPLTVKKHLEHIYQKLDVHGRAGAVGKSRK
jgi:DNA-binding CsgD family transcriptional regulator